MPPSDTSNEYQQYVFVKKWKQLYIPISGTMHNPLYWAKTIIILVYLLIFIQAPTLQNFLVLNSAEHEICPANKSQIINNYKFFLTLPNTQAHENFSANKYENANYLQAKKISCFITSGPSFFPSIYMYFIMPPANCVCGRDEGYIVFTSVHPWVFILLNNLRILCIFCTNVDIHEVLLLDKN